MTKQQKAILRRFLSEDRSPTGADAWDFGDVRELLEAEKQNLYELIGKAKNSMPTQEGEIDKNNGLQLAQNIIFKAIP